MNFFAKFRSSRKFKERHQKTYILPTLFGVAFASVCILLLGIAFASTNNAVYFLCFLLSALGIQSLVLTNRNIEKTEVTSVQVEDFFADESGFARIRLQNSSSEDLYQVDLELSEKTPTGVDVVRSHESREVQIPVKINSAGLHPIPPLRLSSDFPFHFARSWKKHYTENTFAVFPARRGSAEMPTRAFANIHLQTHNQDEFKNHREYNSSDSPRRIDWKVSARTQNLMVKDYDQHSATKVTLRWEDCPQSSADDKKSQLSLWIDVAEKKNFEYALSLPGKQLDFGKGPQHRLLCLRALL